MLLDESAARASWYQSSARERAVLAVSAGSHSVPSASDESSSESLCPQQRSESDRELYMRAADHFEHQLLSDDTLADPRRRTDDFVAHLLPRGEHSAVGDRN